MKNLQKGFVVPLLIAIIALLVIGGGVYIYENKKAEVPAYSTGTQIQTNNQIQSTSQSAPATSQNIPASVGKIIITSISPNPASPNQTVTIKGSGFSTTQPNTVVFSSSALMVGLRSVDGTTITFRPSDYSNLKSGLVYVVDSSAIASGQIIKGTLFLPETANSQFAGKSNAVLFTLASDINVGSVNLHSNIAVTGMQQYTDSNFGFSFWYPSGWVIQQPSSQQYISISGGTVIKTIVVGSASNPSNSIAVQEFTSSGMSITDNSSAGPAGNGSLSLTYFFDPTTHTWMMQDTDGENHTSIVTANVSTNTMGGLHLLRGNARFGDDFIIPLSAKNFLVVSSVQAGTIQEGLLAKTITATDPSVATPINQVGQVQIIQAELSAYTGQ